MSESETQDQAHWLTQIREDAFAILGGWVNPLTGRGDPDRDKNASTQWAPGALLQEQLLGDLFTRNALARAVCLAHPEWGLRNGWNLTLKAGAGETQDVQAAVTRTLAELGAGAALLRAATWGQTFGGGLILVGADDARQTDTPLALDKLKRIRFVRVVSRRHVDIAEVYDNQNREHFGEAASYVVREPTLRGTKNHEAKWHASRVIRLPGPITDDEKRIENDGWDQSILDVVVSSLLKHDGMWDDVGGMVADGSQGVWMIKGLAKAAATGLKDAIEARFRLADRARSMFRALLLDADNEDFKYVHRQFSGIDALLGQSAVRVAGAAQIPVTVLMGQSPAGLNATGDSDLELWYARVRAYQTATLLAPWRRLVQLVFRSELGPTKGKEPEAWAVALADPRSLTPMQAVEMRARQAQVDAAMIANRVVTPEEIALNRYTAEGWSESTQIDLGWRRRFVEFLAKNAVGRSEEELEALVTQWLTSAPQGVQTELGGDPGAPGVPAPSGGGAPNNGATGAVE